MSTLSEGKVLEKFSTVVAVQGQIGELAGLYPPPFIRSRGGDPSAVRTL
jgi:hypothetical protein